MGVGSTRRARRIAEAAERAVWGAFAVGIDRALAGDLSQARLSLHPERRANARHVGDEVLAGHESADM